MRDDNVKAGSIQAWILAARPKTLTGAAVPVMIGCGMAWTDGGGNMQWLPALLCFLFAFIMQIDANFVNDYFDYIRGNDDDSRLGPRRACAQGWVSVKDMRIAIAATTLLACVVGFPLVFYGGLEMILIGVLCVAFCFLYTTTLSYLGLGDLLVIVFFGVVPVCATYYLTICTTNSFPTIEVIIASLACGLVIDDLLIINNYRDIDNDRQAGKITLNVRIGEQASRVLYLALGFMACLMGLIHLSSDKPFAFWLPLLYLFFHYQAWKRMCEIRKGRQLNEVLGLTARNIFIYGLLTTIGCMI